MSDDEADFDSTTILLPDDTEVTVIVADDQIEYIVDDGETTEETTYTPDEALEQAEEIRRREMASWETIWPEEVQPVLDCARALENAAHHLKAGETDE